MKRKKGNEVKKGRVSKQKLLIRCHQRQNVTVLAFLDRLKFKKKIFFIDQPWWHTILFSLAWLLHFEIITCYQLWPKINFAENYSMSVLRWKNNITSKKIRTSDSTAPKKNVKLIEGRSEGQLNNSDIIRHSVCRDQYTKETWPYLIFLIHSWQFWNTLVIFIYAEPSRTNFLLLWLIHKILDFHHSCNVILQKQFRW